MSVSLLPGFCPIPGGPAFLEPLSFRSTFKLQQRVLGPLSTQSGTEHFQRSPKLPSPTMESLRTHGGDTVCDPC